MAISMFQREIKRKLSGYRDLGFLLAVLRQASKLDVTPNHLLLQTLDVTPDARYTKDHDTVARYVNLALLLRKKLGCRDSCLKTSLLLCHFLRKHGIPAQVCFAAQKKDDTMQGHCWVETEPTEAAGEWQVIFRHPQQPFEPDKEILQSCRSIRS